VTEPVVSDASALVAMLVDGGPVGEWATTALSGTQVIAPHLAIFEAANVLRRHAIAGLVSVDQAAQAHADLLDLPIELWPYDILAARVWELRQNLSAYDASYVALAELANATLVTLDRALARSRAVRCAVSVPA
jgi:predicted nucleic acid-binding protein